MRKKAIAVVVHPSHDPEPLDGPTSYPDSCTCRHCGRFVAFGDLFQRVTDAGVAPCDPAAAALQHPTGSPLETITAGTVTAVAGTLTEVTQHTTRQGAAYLTAVLTRSTDTVELELPPAGHPVFSGFFTVGAPVVVAGVVDQRPGHPVLLVRLLKPWTGDIPRQPAAGREQPGTADR